MAVSSATFIKDSVLLLRSILAAQITDPISSVRSSDSKFICTSFPDKIVNYPVITIKFTGMNYAKAGISSENAFYNLKFDIRVWARNEKEKDGLTESIVEALRDYQHGSNKTIENKLHDFNVESIVPIDETGKEGIKSNVIAISYLFIAGE